MSFKEFKKLMIWAFGPQWHCTDIKSLITLWEHRHPSFPKLHATIEGTENFRWCHLIAQVVAITKDKKVFTPWWKKLFGMFSLDRKKKAPQDDSVLNEGMHVDFNFGPNPGDRTYEE